MVKKGGLSLLKYANKMGPFKDPFALFVFSIGVEKYIHEHRPEDFPRVTTRGHVNIRRVRATPLTPEGRLGSALGVPKSLFLKEGHDETDYETVGDIPGFTDGTDDGDVESRDEKMGNGHDAGDSSPDEVLVFVHGWLSDEEAALGRMSLLRYSLEENGYPHPVVGFTWDTEQTVVEWESGKIIARWNGPKLAQFTADYAKENPDTRIRYISNSLGAHPLFSALKTLEESGFEDVVESATVMGGSVPSRSVSVNGEYGDAVRNVVGDVYNYWTPRDRTLRQYYRLAEGTDCVGGAGAEGKTPENYHDRRVEHVPDHYSFMLPHRGCIDEVVQDLGVEPPESLKDAEVTKKLKAFRDASFVSNGEDGKEIEYDAES